MMTLLVCSAVCFLVCYWSDSIMINCLKKYNLFFCIFPLALTGEGQSGHIDRNKMRKVYGFISYCNPFPPPQYFSFFPIFLTSPRQCIPLNSFILLFLPVCLSVCLSNRLSFCLSTCFGVWLRHCLLVCLFVCAVDGQVISKADGLIRPALIRRTACVYGT